MTNPIQDSRETWERLASRRLIEHTIPHNGATRTALLYVPRHRLGRGGVLPLVLAFHGGASDPAAMAQMTAFHRIAEREGFIVAYPTGTKGRSGLLWVPGGRASARATNDIGFVRALLDDLERRFPIDKARIFAAGLSIGGSLVYELACALPDRLAAIAVVSGTMTALHGTPARPLPLIHIHGMKDRRVPFKGGRGPGTTGDKEWLPVATCIEQWRTVNGCLAPPQVVRHGRQGVTGYKSRGTADVDLWLVEEGGHAWPGARREGEPGAEGQIAAEREFSASEAIWTFFAAHPRRRHRAAPALGSGPQTSASCDPRSVDSDGTSVGSGGCAGGLREG